MSEDIENIAELMARDPLSLTLEDRSKIISYYRDNRAKFISGQKMEKLPKTKAAKGPLPNIDLGDLEL